MKNKLKYLFIIIPICYFLVTTFLNFFRKNELERNGTFMVVEIVDVSSGAYTAQNVTYKYIVNDKIEFGYQQYSILIDNFNPKKGQKYLGKFIRDKYSTNYLFLNIKLPDSIDVKQTVPMDCLIDKDTNISFMRL